LFFDVSCRSAQYKIILNLSVSYNTVHFIARLDKWRHLANVSNTTEMIMRKDIQQRAPRTWIDTDRLFSIVNIVMSEAPSIECLYDFIAEPR